MTIESTPSKWRSNYYDSESGSQTRIARDELEDSSYKVLCEPGKDGAVAYKMRSLDPVRVKSEFSVVRD